MIEDMESPSTPQSEQDSVLAQHSLVEAKQPVRKPQYFELSGEERDQEVIDFLRQHFPDLNPGSLRDDGDILFRSISLPDDPAVRRERIEEIIEKGTDRTDESFTGKFDNFYARAAKQAGVNQIDVLNLMTASNFYEKLPLDKLRDLLSYYPFRKKSPAGILVFDRHKMVDINSLDFTFKDPQNKDQALLAIISIPNG